MSRKRRETDRASAPAGADAMPADDLHPSTATDVDLDGDSVEPGSADAFGAPVDPAVGAADQATGPATVARFGDEDDRSPAERELAEQEARAKAERASEIGKLSLRHAEIVGEIEALGDPVARTNATNDRRKALMKEREETVTTLDREIGRLLQEVQMLQKKQGAELQRISDLNKERVKIESRAKELGAGPAELAPLPPLHSKE